MTESNPPLLQSMAELLNHSGGTTAPHCDNRRTEAVVEEYQCELPLIDLRGLRSEDAAERRDCAAAISRAAAEWGFFQVVGHGISLDLLRKMRREQVKLIGAPFKRKVAGGILNDSYRWGTPTATAPNQFSWSEAFHVPLSKVSDDEACCYEDDFSSF
ncbi:gibberellin 2beta-dioxygenase, partial [Sarracenia purpurea var. burkii]